jgi:VanZ family protein
MPVVWFRKINPWLPPAAWALCILLASSIPGDDIPRQEILGLDKMVHLGLYGILGGLLNRTRLSFLQALGLASVFGMIDELYQNLTPQRSPDPMDWLADVIGACAGILLTRWFLNKKVCPSP